MKKSQIVLSFIAVIFAAAGAFASTALVTNSAQATISSGCINGTTVEDGCTLSAGADRIRCTMSTIEGIKDAHFAGSSCNSALYRPAP